MKLKWSHAAFILLIFLVSCKESGRERSKAPAGLPEGDYQESIEYINESKNVYHLIPSPAEMLGVMNVGALEFDASMLNPIGNMDIYLDSRSQMLNMGVYLSDLAFAALFGRYNESVDYLEVIRDLSRQIRVDQAINDAMIDRAKSQLRDLDTLLQISNEAFVNMTTMSEASGHPRTMILITAGAFIESLYLLSNLVGSYAEAEYLMQHLADQKYAVDNLMVFAESMSDDPGIDELLMALQPVKQIYDSMHQKGGVTTVKKQSSGKLVIGATQENALKSTEIEQIRQNVSNLRSKIVAGKF